MKFKNSHKRALKKLLALVIANTVFKLFIASQLNLETGSYLVLFADTLNIFLLFLSGKLIFNSQVGFWSAFLYAISPWTLYYSLLDSVQIIFLTLLLI